MSINSLLENVRIAVDEKQCAEAIRMSVHFLRKDRMGKRIIPFYRIGDCIRYDLGRVREALIAAEEGGVKPKARAKNAQVAA
jgi:hypothetical protein